MNEFEKFIEGRYGLHDQKQNKHDKTIKHIEKELALFDEAGLSFEQEIEELAEKTEDLLKKRQAQHDPS
ncbi:hypothetical protein BSF_12050 [Bacillus subtilis]|uniref:hypothetical protein n=1 Tax=Bacillus halotolerans TaxID=260554 RepID=UPI0007510506|nr:hypothetical protein [Bacillus halotolerans]KUP31137.1 hypothetical protein AU387_15895 [Bacillus halotolerans]MBL4964505.1 hypothetical protein [Bacillus halotolerans]BDG79476.1 hypothetical protein BSF_12050 [Bacillus subtilis]